MNINIKYFAAIAEHTGKTEEKKEISYTSITQLFEEIKAEYNIPHTFEDIRVAVNQEYAEPDAVLEDNDTVVFIPPVAGG